jgi:hypothetical protein
MKQVIEFNKKGRILKGVYEGWYILIEDDTKNTGGYYIFISSSPNVKGVSGIDDGAEGYDEWLENQEQIQSYFDRSGWLIKWLE